MTIARSPSLGLVIERAMQHQLSLTHFCIPGQVTAYDATANTVDVQPCLGKTIFEEDRELSEDLPILPSVPLMFPGSGNYRLTFPIAVGDYVLVVFADRSIEEFWVNGGRGIPADVRSHNLSDGFAIPGVIVQPTALQSVATNVMVLGKNGNPHQPAARKNDAVKVTLTNVAGGGGLAALAALLVCASPGSPCTVLPASTLDITGNITAGSADVDIT